MTIDWNSFAAGVGVVVALFMAGYAFTAGVCVACNQFLRLTINRNTTNTVTVKTAEPK